MTVAREEIFGPVIVVIPFDDEDEAIAIANDSPYGLYGYVFCERHRPGHGRRQAAPVAATSASTRSSATTRPRSAASSTRGVGRDGGSWGLHAYCEMQSIMWKG